MREYFSTIKLLINEIDSLRFELYTQMFMSATISFGKVALTFILAQIIDFLVERNINWIVIMLIIYPVLSFTLNRVNLYREKHRLKHFDDKVDEIFDGEVSPSVNHVIEIVINKAIPISSFLLFAIGAIAYYSPLIAAWCMFKVIFLLFWVSRYTFKKNTSSRIPKLSYIVTHGHMRELFTIFAKYIALIVAISLYLRGRISVGGVYAIFSWTSDVLSNIQKLVRTIHNNHEHFTRLREYLLERRNVL